MSIHPTAIVDPRAEIAGDAEVGAYAVIEGPVRVGPGTRVGAHAYLCGHTTLGTGCAIHPYAAVGGTPQDLHAEDGDSSVVIGDGSVIREYASVHRASRSGGATTLGRGCLIMAHAHVGHDCVLGDGVVLTNAAQCSGHVQIGDRAVLSGMAMVHQFCRVGKRAMCVASARIIYDVPPYFITDMDGGIARVNVVGCRREGLSRQAIAAVKDAFKLLYYSDMPFEHAIRDLEQRRDTPEVSEIVQFIRAEAKRPVAGPAALRRQRRAERSMESLDPSIS